MAHDKPIWGGQPGPDETPRSLQAAKRVHVERVLRETGFNLAEAAGVLAVDGIELLLLMHELGIEEPKADRGHDTE